MIKVLYLFNKNKTDYIRSVKENSESDNHLYGMLRLGRFGMTADFLEIEQFFWKPVCAFLRKYLLNIHFVHAPLLVKILTNDLVFTSTAFGSFFLTIIWPFKKPRWVVFDFNLSGVIKNYPLFKKQITHFMVSRASGIVTLSRGEENEIKKIFPNLNNVKFIPLGTDTVFFTPQPDRVEENIVLCPGRDPGRDYETLLSAVKGMNVKIVLTANPKTLAKYLPFPSNVTVSNFSTLELREQYNRAKVVVLPLNVASNYFDSMGCSTLVEAMAMGKAIIATDSATMKSYINNGESGILVPCQKTNDLREAIQSVIDDRLLRARLGANARRFAEENCDAEKFAYELSNFFKQVLKND